MGKKNCLKFNLLGLDIKIDFEEMLTNALLVGKLAKPEAPILGPMTCINKVIQMSNDLNEDDDSDRTALRRLLLESSENTKATEDEFDDDQIILTKKQFNELQKMLNKANKDDIDD